MFTEKQKKQILEHSLKLEDALRQKQMLQEEFPYVQIEKPCTLGDGILDLSSESKQLYVKKFQSAVDVGRVSLFIPASGAASRMFKALLSAESKTKLPTIAGLKNASNDEKTVFEFLCRLKDFPFYDELRQSLASDQYDLDALLKQNDYDIVLKYVLFEKGLNYASLPKGLIVFHRAPAGQSRTAFEEHLVEASQYAADINQKIKIHFTIACEFENQIKEAIQKTSVLLKEAGFCFEIEYSEQKASTDTLAIDSEGDLVENSDGTLLFRPGGHGALIENLNELLADIVFIKNIDNILPQNANESVVLTQKILGGVLVEIQERVFSILNSIEKAEIKEEHLEDIFLSESADWAHDLFGFKFSDGLDRAKQLLTFLNRPMRVCGMVKNEGEPGGGPFWVRNRQGQLTAQIVEKAQIDFSCEEQRNVMKNATHFNPVNIVCGLTDFRGKKFDLKKYIDPKTGFVSQKSFEGKPLKALELPGLWNGAMADWLTIFVDVPLETFSPVKELNDLLRPAHQKWKEYL